MSSIHTLIVGAIIAVAVAFLAYTLHSANEEAVEISYRWNTVHSYVHDSNYIRVIQDSSDGRCWAVYGGANPRPVFGPVPCD